jgi:hypothetical protein
MSHSSRRVRSFLIQSIGASLLIGGVLLACSETTGTRGNGQASLSFAIASQGSTSANLASIIVPGTGPVVDLTSADVVFDDIKFEGSHVRGVDDDDEDTDLDDEDTDLNDDNDSDSDSDANDNVTFRAGSATVALPLQGGVITPFTGQLPEGTFHRLSMRAEFVRLRGTVDGQAFDVTVPVNSKLKLFIDPPLVVGTTPTPANVSVNIDVLSWLRNASGVVVDPRLLNTNDQLRREFRHRVRASFKAFKDDDHDGHRGDD